MAYEVWLSTIDAPTLPAGVAKTLPIVTGSVEAIGQIDSARNVTRPTVRVTAKLFIESSEIQNFISFWRTTLKRGRKLFTADWINDIGYEGYVGRLLNYTLQPEGGSFNADLQFDLLPDVRLNLSNDPDPWPSV